MNWDWEDVWQAVVVSLVLALVTFVGIWIFSPKNVDYYYLSSESAPRGSGFCVYAHWTWHNDEVAFCSDDKDRALEFAAKANASATSRGGK